MNFLTKRTGCRSVIAVEFEVEINGIRPATEWWGYLWLWADGRCIGETHDKEVLAVGLESLFEAAVDARPRVNRLLSSLPPEEAMRAVMWARYGDEDTKLERLFDSGKDLEPFEILPRETGPFFENWEAILLEEGNMERFLWRKTSHPVCETQWERGTFKKVVLQARTDYQKLVSLAGHSN